MPQSSFTLVALLVTLYIPWVFAADKLERWPIDIAVPDSATNVSKSFDDQFQTLNVSFVWSGTDANELHEFYSAYFSSLDWEDPTPKFPRSGSAWSSYGMTFTQNNSPVATYASLWKAKTVPLLANVILELNAYENEIFRGSATIQVSPEIDLSPLFRLNSLLGEDPKNWFMLHRAVNGNPLDPSTISLQPNYRDETDPILSQYYDIIDSIIEAFQEWKRNYVAG